MIKLRVDDETAIPLSVDSSSAVSMTVSEAFIDRGGSAIQNNKNATPSTSQVVVTPDPGFDGMAKVTVAAMPQGEIDQASLSYDTYLLRGRITAEANVTQAGYVPIGGNVARAYCDELLPSENPKTVTPTTSEQTAVDANKWTKGQIKVGPIPPEYIVPTGTKSISANGAGIDVKAYEKVDVAVPGITPSGTLAIATNGSHDVTNYATAAVAVPASAVDSGTKSITANGNGQDVVGYAAVNVNVPNSYAAADEGKVVQSGALVSQSSQTIEENGTYDTTLIDELTVNVSGGGGAWTWKKDGKTHIWLDITDNASLTQYIGVRCGTTAFSITLDWGDGSTPVTHTGTGATNYNHTYSAQGQYEIVLDHNGSSSVAAFVTGNLNNRACCGNVVAIEASNTKTWYFPACPFLTNLKHVNLGKTWSTNIYQFQMCVNLEDITAAETATGQLSNYYFQQADHLKSVNLKYTSIGAQAFYRTTSMTVQRIPSTCASIAAQAFQNTVTLREIHLEGANTSLLNTNAFDDIHTNFKIYVPYSADHSILNSYKAASNWSTYADRIFEESAP